MEAESSPDITGFATCASRRQLQLSQTSFPRIFVPHAQGSGRGNVGSERPRGTFAAQESGRDAHLTSSAPQVHPGVSKLEGNVGRTIRADNTIALYVDNVGDHGQALPA